MAATDELQTPSGMVVLIMPNPHANDPEHRENPLANLDFGPAGTHADDHDQNNITFREVEAGVGRAIVRGDHPLIEDLLRKYPQIKVGEDSLTTIYICSVCDKEWGSKSALRAHARSHKTDDE